MLKKVFALAICLIIAACASTPTATLPTINQVEYRIGAGDTLRLTERYF